MSGIICCSFLRSPNLETKHYMNIMNNCITIIYQLYLQFDILIFRKDTYGNTALHYAKSYPDQSIVKFLLYQVRHIFRQEGTCLKQPKTCASVYRFP